MVKSVDNANPMARPYGSIYPRQYVALRAPPPSNVGDATTSSSSSSPHPSPAATIDGDLTKPFWADVPWSEDFVDIATETPPKFRTKVKMRWDDAYLYVGAHMEETDVWGTLTEHNSVIFQDNDFEVFVDTDGTNHNYKEFEINALGTTWSLSLNKPYDDGGGENSRRVDPDGKFTMLMYIWYDMEPHLQSATKVYPNGAVNDPGTQNTHWTAEIALPLSKLMESNPLAKSPAEGVFWRINFSRVQWGFKFDADGKYSKAPCCQSCAKPGGKAEDNWVWSKQGEVAMHLPERWGIVQFKASAETSGQMDYYEEWPSRCAAMAVYYAMKGFHEKEGQYTIDVEALKPHSNPTFPLFEDATTSIKLTAKGWEAQATVGSHTASVNDERYLIVSTDNYSTS
ncbi:hypothetical protein ACHAWF_003542 [Thalassiosira exigua]